MAPRARRARGDRKRATTAAKNARRACATCASTCLRTSVERRAQRRGEQEAIARDDRQSDATKRSRGCALTRALDEEDLDAAPEEF